MRERAKEAGKKPATEGTKAFTSGPSRSSGIKKEESSEEVYTYETDTEDTPEEKPAEERRKEKATPAPASGSGAKNKGVKDASVTPPSRALLGLGILPSAFPSKPNPVGAHGEKVEPAGKDSAVPRITAPANRERKSRDHGNERAPLERKKPEPKRKRKRKRGSKGKAKRERGQDFKAWREEQKEKKLREG